MTNATGRPLPGSYLSPGHIRALRAEAAADYGDVAIVRLCDRALAGDYDANWRVAVLDYELGA